MHQFIKLFNNGTSNLVFQIRVKWQARDDESRIAYATGSVTTHTGGALISFLQTFSIQGTLNHVAIPLDHGEELSPGYEYFCQVAVCNGAGHCSTNKFGPLLVDSSRPYTPLFIEPYPHDNDQGDFDYEGLWQSENETPQSWSGSSITMKLGGFIDGESGIRTVFAKFGTAWGKGDLLATQQVPWGGGVEEHTFTLDSALTAGGRLYSTLWAQNHVAQFSHISHQSWYVMDGGLLLMQKHNCEVYTCMNDCTCAEENMRCKHQYHPDSATCEKGDIANAPAPLTVNDGWASEDEQYTLSAKCLSSWWVYDNPADEGTYTHFEYSFGTDKAGAGIVADPVNQKFWFDTNENQWAIHCLPLYHPLHEDEFIWRLEHKSVYKAYVRAWVSASEFYEFESNGITVDLSAPVIRIGAILTDNIDPAATDDIDFATIGTILATRGDTLFAESDSYMVESAYGYGKMLDSKCIYVLAYFIH